MMFHDGEMHGVTSRQLPMPQDDFLGTSGDGPINRQYLIDDAEEGVKRLPDPLRERHAARARHALDFPVFGILQNHL